MKDTEIAELRALSSRATISPHRFVNEYHWGDFKGKPKQLMERFFDAFLYHANWGTRELMFRLPATREAEDAFAAFAVDDHLASWRKGAHLLLHFRSLNEDGEWVEGAEDWLPNLLPLREGLRQGDLRALYLGWLVGVGEGCLRHGIVEPPVPPGLDRLSPPLEKLADFLRLSPDLIRAASEGNPEGGSKPAVSSPVDDIQVEFAIFHQGGVPLSLPGGEMFLEDLRKELKERVVVEMERRQRFAAMAQDHTRRTVGQLLDRAEALIGERKRLEAGQAQKKRAERAQAALVKRRQHLDRMRGRETELWAEVEDLVSSRKPSAYDEAVEKLVDLRDLTPSGTEESFVERVRRLCEEHQRKGNFLDRVRRAGLSS